MQTSVTVNCAASPVILAGLSCSTHRLSGGESHAPENPVRMGDAQRESESKPRALVVDDVPDVMEMMALFLKHAGYEVSMAACGPEALEAASLEHFDVIVSDIGMPGMDGYELACALRALPQCSNVPIIAVTGFSIYDDKGRALQSGFNAQMTKPVNPVALLELIEKLRD